jgi:hypothetical protein
MDDYVDPMILELERRPTIMLSGFAPGSRIARHFGGDR